jgi:DNA recombination protein RmuC
MLTVAAIAVLALALAGFAVWLARALQSLRAESSAGLDGRSAEVDRRLQAVTETMDRRLGELDQKVDRRLEQASQQTSAIHERLGKVGEATAQLAEQAKGLGQLQQLLRPPKARGGFGELLLSNLLADRLPAHAYSLQHGFSSGERVDAVIRVEKLVPVDAKFPLDNFERLAEAQDEEARQLHEKAFARDVKGHIDAISAKYVKPAEGTYDFAFMYLPVEGIYYELVCGKTGAMLKYAHDRRVFPVSPTTITANLQVIAFGLKGMEFEQSAHEVMAYLADLRKDFGRFRDDFAVVGKHLGNAQTKYVDAEKRLDRFDGRLERASEHEAPDTVEAFEAPRALDAA